jgi:outer membrane receptor protein involved in Fe transport
MAVSSSPGEVRFDVPPGALSDALIDYSRQADLRLLVSSGLVRGVRTPGLHGVFSAEEALTQLLGDTGLEGRIGGSGVVIITEKTNGKDTQDMTIRTSMQAKSGGAALMALLMGTTAASAQTVADQNDEGDVIVVIGTAGSAGTDRKDASFAVTTIPTESIERFQPQSTADLFRQIPGVWVESSGGVAGANIFVRGLPSGGDAPFVTLAINGGPIYGASTLSFFEQSSIFRTDFTIEQVEGLRGGPSSVFGAGQPGLTVNFNLKEGGDVTEGTARYTYSDFGAHRVDAVVSGPVTDTLTYMVGGYVRGSDGLRDTEFQSEEGYQITGHLVKDLGRGELSGYIRATDDHGQWVLPQALNTGNDAGTFAQLGDATRNRTIQVGPNGETREFDFADVRGWDGIIAGSRFSYELTDALTVRNVLTYTNGDADTFGFVPSGAAVPAADLAAVIGTPVTTAGGETLGSGDFVQTYGHWVVLKEIEAITNDLSANFSAGGHDFTFGAYIQDFSADDTWFIGNPIPVQNTANGDLLDASITPADIAAAGGDAGFNFGLASEGNAQNFALYAADSWQVTPQLRIDGGVRREWFELDYLLDSGPGYADGTTDLDTEVDSEEWAWTLAGNYAFTPDWSAFVRYSNGFLFPHFDEIREGAFSVDDVKQFEGGLKYSGDFLRLYATAFYNTNDAFAANVGSVVANAAFETEAVGIELDGSVRLDAFQMRFNATFQDAEITNSTTASQEGNRVQRQPESQIRVEPSYSFQTGAFETVLYGAATFVGDRFGDLDNTVELEAYEKIDAGIIITHESGTFFQVFADNLTDSDGITEGDPRNPAAPNGRPIFGRSVNFTVGVDF